MERFKIIETLFEEGYELNLEGDCIGGCDKWLEAWQLIKELFAEGVAEDIYDLNRKYKWEQFPGNVVQSLEMELCNAGIDDKEYHQKRMEFCRELLQWSGNDELLINNTRIALAEAHYMSGDESGGEQIFEEWMQEDPDCGWIYSGWAECLRLSLSGEQYEKAEEILLAGYAREGLRDKLYVVDGLVNLYVQMGKADKANEWRKISSRLHRDEPVRVAKTGRNEPCPCGSGKKYKKCCGS